MNEMHRQQHIMVINLWYAAAYAFCVPPAQLVRYGFLHAAIVWLKAEDAGSTEMEGKMSLEEFTVVFALAVGLSMDAFAVAVCKGLAMKKMSWKNAGIVGLWFGGFQALMPAAGYILGIRFRDKITAIDHWIAFVLLGGIGINMLREALSGEEEHADEAMDRKTMFLMAVATSIDALAVGIAFVFININIQSAVLVIGVVTFLLSALGVKIGNVFGAKYKARAEFMGGIILILLGAKILLEDLGIF